jgi:UDP-N-acetylmuramyl pentapeptide synthase
MKKISTSKLAEIVGFKGELIDVVIERVETDSRKIQKGDLFIAIRGE